MSMSKRVRTVLPLLVAIVGVSSSVHAADPLIPRPLPPGLRPIPGGNPRTDLTGFTGNAFVAGDAAVISNGSVGAPGGFDSYFAPGHGSPGRPGGYPYTYPET